MYVLPSSGSRNFGWTGWGVGVLVGVAVSVGVGLGVLVGLEVGVLVGVFVGVGVAVAVEAFVGVIVGGNRSSPWVSSSRVCLGDDRAASDTAPARATIKRVRPTKERI
jgi:hypothetical protein